MLLVKAFETIGIGLPRELQIVGKAILRRSVIGVSGSDAVKFLNGLTTNNLTDIRDGQFTAFLNPQGRMLYDVFIFKKDRDAFYVDCDERIGIDLFYHLQQHKLRAKVEIVDVSREWQVETRWNLGSLLDGPKMTLVDPRGSLGLLRSLSHKSDTDQQAGDKFYHLLRYAAGIPEGPLEIKRVQSIPLEYNLDWMGGVSFDKGCYIGQELVARTHHRGTIRKRVMPFRMGAGAFVASPEGIDGIPSGSDLYPIDPPDSQKMGQVREMQMDKPVGRVIGTMGNLGMALMRLPNWTEGHRFAVHRPSPTGTDKDQFVLVEPYKPHWWPSLNPQDYL